MPKVNLRNAISAVNAKGALLVFAIKDQSEPESLWSHFYPRSKMKWEWTDDGDDRVANLWHLRERLSSSGEVVYAKWFRGRATLLSRELMPSLLHLLNFEEGLSRESTQLLRILEDNSPLSTKQLKEASGLQGKVNEGDYTRRLAELWSRLLIVGTGEVDDGAFPSLAMGATKLYFEEEWAKSQRMNTDEAFKSASKVLGPESLFFKYLLKQRSRNFVGTLTRPKKKSPSVVTFQSMVAGTVTK